MDRSLQIRHPFVKQVLAHDDGFTVTVSRRVPIAWGVRYDKHSAMKVDLLDATSLAKQFPIADRLPGWFFRITERSAGAYYAEGIDLQNRRVSTDGTNAERVLGDCIAMARGISKTS